MKKLLVLCLLALTGWAQAQVQAPSASGWPSRPIGMLWRIAASATSDPFDAGHASHGLTKPGSRGFGHYKAFISWPFQRENTPLGRVKDWGANPEEIGQPFPGDVVAQALKRERG